MPRFQVRESNNGWMVIDATTGRCEVNGYRTYDDAVRASVVMNRKVS